MECNWAFSFTLLAVCIVTVVGNTCPYRWSILPSSCRSITGTHCWYNQHCPSGQICCQVAWCGRRCRTPMQVATVKPAVQETLIKTLQVPNAVVPRIQESVTVKASTTKATNPGRCNSSSRIKCTGRSCTHDSECSSSREKCCRNRCGNRVCSPALRSSIFSFFSG